jgi:hypothetical protein
VGGFRSRVTVPAVGLIGATGHPAKGDSVALPATGCQRGRQPANLDSPLHRAGPAEILAADPTSHRGRLPPARAMTDPPGLTAILVDAIRVRPDDHGAWADLSDWLWIQGRDDKAVAVRVLWPTLLDNLSLATLEATLADVAQDAKLLGTVAREVEERAQGRADD